MNLFHRGYFDRLDHSRDFTYHEIGATVGGPIVSNRTFFFYGYQRHHEKDTDTFTGDVPTPETFNGDFSFGGVGFPIYDPRSTMQDASGTWIREQFPNNQIPPSLFDPVAQNVIAQDPWRPANDPGTITPRGNIDNLVLASKGRFYFSRFDHKIDHQFSARHKIFGRYSRMRTRNGSFSQQVIWDIAAPPITTPIDQGNLVVSDTYIFNPTTINEFCFGANRRTETRLPESFGQD